MIVFAVSTGSTLATNVNQTPTDKFKNANESLELQCLHSISSYNVILWYKQTHGGTLTLLGYLYATTKSVEPEFSGKFEMDGDANINKKNSLTISNLLLNDSAVYFCAASLHSVSDHLPLSTITHLLSAGKLSAIRHSHLCTCHQCPQYTFLHVTWFQKPFTQRAKPCSKSAKLWDK